MFSSNLLIGKIKICLRLFSVLMGSLTELKVVNFNLDIGFARCIRLPTIYLTNNLAENHQTNLSGSKIVLTMSGVASRWRLLT